MPQIWKHYTGIPGTFWGKGIQFFETKFIFEVKMKSSDSQKFSNGSVFDSFSTIQNKFIQLIYAEKGVFSGNKKGH